MIATGGFLTALECSKFVFGGVLPQIQLGELTAYSAPHAPSWFKGGHSSKGMGGEEKEGEEMCEKGGEGKGNAP